MKKSSFLLAMLSASALLAAPSLSFAAGTPAKPPMVVKPAGAPAKPPRHGAARNLVNTGKATVQRGKPSLRAQKENAVRLIGRAEGLKPARMQLRQQTLDAYRNYRTNPNSATRAAWKSAAAAYMPVRQAHETARGQRNAAVARYRMTKHQRLAALAATSRTAGVNDARPATVARPAIRRQARVTSLQGFARAAGASGASDGVYSNVGLALAGRASGGQHYTSRVFIAQAAQHYVSLDPAEAGSNRTSSSAGSANSSRATLPTMPFFPTLRTPIQQNAYDDINDLQN